MSSPAFRHLPFESSSGNGIDDDLESFFMTGVYSKHASWWEVDLGKSYPLKQIVIHDKYLGRDYLPLRVMTSEDGIDYTVSQTVSTRDDHYLWTIALNKAGARFVRLQSSNNPRPFKLYEIEIFSSERQVEKE